MSSNSHSGLPSAGMSPASTSTGSTSNHYEIEHIQFLSEMIGNLYQSDEFSDTVLVVQNEKISVHKVILAARSEYFRALLYGGLSESSQNEIQLHDTNLVAFKALLKYIYSGKLSFRNLKEDVILDILGKVKCERQGHIIGRYKYTSCAEVKFKLECALWAMAKINNKKSVLTLLN